MGIEGQVVAVTGVTSGVGRETARVFAERGAVVCGMGRTTAAGEALAAEITAAGGEFEFVTGDIRSVGDCAAFVERAAGLRGRIDVLINNAGTPGDPVIVDSHLAEEQWWDDIVDTNLKGAFFCSRYALGHMLEAGSGLIINIASTNAVAPLSRMQAYNASKAGLVHLGQGLAVEYQDKGIRVNTIVLGSVADGDAGRRTRHAITEYLTGVVPSDERKASSTVRTAREVGSYLASLCDTDAAVLTGAVIALDGGVSAGLLGNKYWLHTASRVKK
ncbi:SDR family NAD(P)-dependent oxidoreductase [Nakamurella sp. YIM 132087]|uniref:SDR family NAD(P)-dependent oxidoreductase n=1 Tax=Nakamurella alba TaxID=2665158 RepID=A0A7K1FP71_9ACTN|nr:SDR family oxidoreductase [Nakamurella alba]MTD15948.1 SDR family NAD(P)-dependent oxidoreductase [Nakamurella alba]